MSGKTLVDVQPSRPSQGGGDKGGDRLNKNNQNFKLMEKVSRLIIHKGNIECLVNDADGKALSCRFFGGAVWIDTRFERPHVALKRENLEELIKFIDEAEKIKP